MVDVRMLYAVAAALIEDLHRDDQDAHSNEYQCQHALCDVRWNLALDARAYLCAGDDPRY